MAFACPRCKEVIPARDLHADTSTAHCRRCDRRHSIPSLRRNLGFDPDVDLDRPPEGAWYLRDGCAVVLGATNRSVGTASTALVLALLANGLFGVTAVVLFGGMLRSLEVPALEWLLGPLGVPTIGPEEGVGMLVAMLVVGFFTVRPVNRFYRFAAGGRTEVRIENGHGVLFRGVGSRGSRRTFDASGVEGVRIEERPNPSDDIVRARIVLEPRADSEIVFGASLSDERRSFLAAALRKTLSPPD